MTGEFEVGGITRTQRVVLKKIGGEIGPCEISSEQLEVDITAYKASREAQLRGVPKMYGEPVRSADGSAEAILVEFVDGIPLHEAVQAHPEWFQRDAQDNPVRHTEDPRLYRTCMFTSYMTEYLPASVMELFWTT